MREKLITELEKLAEEAAQSSDSEIKAAGGALFGLLGAFCSGRAGQFLEHTAEFSIREISRLRGEIVQIKARNN